MVTEALGWGIAGGGWVARDYVAPAIAASRNGRLVAVLDPDATARGKSAWGDARRCATLDTFMATPALQAVYVATPNNLHRPLVEAAAGAGLAVLCEKPMAATFEDASAMLAACRAAGVVYATAFDQRFHAAHVHLSRMVASGELGRVTAVRIVYACWLPRDWAPDNWRVDARRAGGGALIDLAPHGLDLAGMLIGQPIIDLAAMRQSRVQDYGVEDGAVMIGRTADDVLVQLHVAYNCPDILPRRRLEVLGTGGLAVLTDTMGQTGGGTMTFTALDGVPRAVDVPLIGRSPFLGQVEAFGDAVLSNVEFGYPGEADLALMGLLARLQVSPSLASAA